LDTEIPICRFRGTLIKRLADKIKIVGWQRNVSRLQKMDVSFPTIIRMELDNDMGIRMTDVDPSFKGSKGPLCQYRYLDKNLREKFINAKIDDRFFKLIQIGNLHCFHFVEVIGGILSCLQIMDERNMDYIYEEEVIDGYVENRNLNIMGIQRMNFLENPVMYAMVYENALNNIKFNEKGMIYAEEMFPVEFYLDDKKMFTKEFQGINEKKLCSKIKIFCLEALAHLKLIFTQDIQNSFMCSNIFPQAFIGLLVQVVAMKMYYNNSNYVLHCLNGIQHFGDIPRCIGAINSPEEASKYFPLYDLSAIFEA